MLEKKDYVTKDVVPTEVKPKPKPESAALAKRVKHLEDVLYSLVALRPDGTLKKIRNIYK